MIYPKGIDRVAILNGRVDYAIGTTREQISAGVNVIVQNRLSELKGKIDSARSNYNVEKEAKTGSLREVDALKRAQLQDELSALSAQLKVLRSDRIFQLNETIGIAGSLGMRKPATLFSFAEPANTRAGSVIRNEVNNQQTPLCFMGGRHLRLSLPRWGSASRMTSPILASRRSRRSFNCWLPTAKLKC